MSFLEAAFAKVCSEAKEPEAWYVCLMVESPYYGGPEEGGWWGSDTVLCAYQEFPSEEAANRAAEAVKKLAQELTDTAQKEYGDHCLREMEWLEARGLEADYLPEPDGPDTYHVIVSQGIPENRRGCRHYS